VPRAALRAALEAVQSGTTSGLAPGARLDVGRALVTGIGAPRDIAAGVALLEGLAGTGDADAAALLAEALEPRDPEAAYGWALRAAAAGAPGAAARLDRLEREVPPAAALAAQDTLAGPLDAVAGAGRAVLSDLAQARLTGQGAVRSYRHAATLARLIGASGDPEGHALLQEIDARMAGGGAAWSAVEDEAAATAIALWLGQAQ
jgi:TPR repeat protein